MTVSNGCTAWLCVQGHRKARPLKMNRPALLCVSQSCAPIVNPVRFQKDWTVKILTFWGIVNRVEN